MNVFLLMMGLVRFKKPDYPNLSNPDFTNYPNNLDIQFNFAVQ